MAGNDDGIISGGGLAVTGTSRVSGLPPVLAELVAQDIPGRLAAGDPTLWGPAAQPEATIRLGWLTLAETSRPLLDKLALLRADLQRDGLNRVVLSGMGGSSLAPEVITQTVGADLTILDTTDPGRVRDVLAHRLAETVVVVSSKSGGTIETDSHRRAFQQAFADLGLSNDEIGQRFVIVTDPNSPLAAIAESMGARALFLADPNVGGRYSALSAFGLVPSALAGVDVAELLDQAADFATTLGDSDGPACQLGTALGLAAAGGRDKMVVAADGSGIIGLSAWIEQLVAESTGKNSTGILPVALPAPPLKKADDEIVVLTGGAHTPRQLNTPAADTVDITVTGGLGAQFLAWEYATALVGYLLEINPFDQPNVAESKENTGRILIDGRPIESPHFTTSAVQGYGSIVGNDLAAALAELTGHPGLADGYLAVMAYLDPDHDGPVEGLQELLAAKCGRPVTFGWGPRFLHSTGQYHKGGPPNGIFLQITGEPSADLPIPNQPFTFGELQAAQAAGDRVALTSRGRPLLHLHLTDRVAGLAQLLEAAR